MNVAKYFNLKNYVKYLMNSLCNKRVDYTKKKLDFPPSYATLLIGDLCSNKCIYCVYHNPKAGESEITSGFYNRNWKMSFEDFKTIIDKLIENNVPRVHLCANGEPFLNKNMMNYIDYVNSKMINLSLQTNFQKPAIKYLDELAKRKIQFIGTDIVGGTKESFEKMKVGSKWDYLFNSIEIFGDYCENYNNLIPVEGYCVVSRQCYKYVEALIEKCSHYKNIKSIIFHNIHPFGFNEFTQFDHVIRYTDEEIKKVIRSAVKLGEEKGIRVVEPSYFRDTKDFNCKNFWGRIMINHPDGNLGDEEILGNVRPGGCMYGMLGEDRYIGNILHDDFENIWNNPKLVRARELSIEGKFADEWCKKCPNHFR